MTKVKPDYYLYVTPWLAFGFKRRPCWLLRVIQRLVLGWRWYANEGPKFYGLSINDPYDPKLRPYDAHVRGLEGSRNHVAVEQQETEPRGGLDDWHRCSDVLPEAGTLCWIWDGAGTWLSRRTSSGEWGISNYGKIALAEVLEYAESMPMAVVHGVIAWHPATAPEPPKYL